MHPILRKQFLISVALAVALPATGANWFDFFKPKPPPGQTSGVPATISLAGLSQDQIAQGLKEALSKGVQQAVAALGKPDGFLKDLNVKIPMPESLRAAERTVRTLGQEKLADEFVTTMNRAAEQAVPEAAAVLGDAVKQMSLTDAQAILAGTNNAATQFFRRTSETNLFHRFRPIVAKATAQAGVTRAYKTMMDKVGLAGSLGASFLGQAATDLDGYITRKALDGLFLKIAEEEKRIRANPAARTTDLLQRVFGAVGNR